MSADRDEPSASSGMGLQLREAHYPGRAPVDAYGNGGFRFADMSHRGSVLCLPSGIYGWAPAHIEEVDPPDLTRLLNEDGLELLLLGTGDELRPLPSALRESLANGAFAVEPMSTGAAVRTLNVLLAEGRAVGAALLAVE